MTTDFTLAKCELCPRRCGVNRLAGDRGYCRAGSGLEIYRYAPHFGEEPPVSGSKGSGTVFFGRCTLRCLYCQNHLWSQGECGSATGVEALNRALCELRALGCHNWNLVSPTPWLLHIREALEGIRGEGASLPVVYNTSGFERVETLAEFEGLTDIYLTDLRYSREASAQEGSGNAEYVAVSRRALLEMWRQKGHLKLDADGVARSGTICRLLVLPGLAGEAVENLRWLAEAVGVGIAVSIMAQYVPAHRAAGMDAPWGRRITKAEYERVIAAAEDLGFMGGWMQDFDAETAEELIGFKMAPQGPAAGTR